MEDTVLPEKVQLLTNGLEMVIEDHTRGYFGDYHRVKLVVIAQMPLELVHGLTEDERVAAHKLFGSMVLYTKTLEKMGVGSAAICSVKNDLLAHFTNHSLPYLADQSFPAQLVRSALRRKHLVRIVTSYANDSK
jgi:hypothetical protein